MFVHQVMTTDPIVTSAERSAAHAASLLIDHDITGLPVVDGGGCLVGIISELDLLRAIRDDVDLQQVKVGELMDRRPLFLVPDVTLATAIDIMDEWQVRWLPISVRGRPVGILSRSDALLALARHRRPARAIAGAGGAWCAHFFLRPSMAREGAP